MSDVVPVSAVPMPRIDRRDLDRPWQWLNAGWSDLRRAGPISLMYGLACSLAGGAKDGEFAFAGFLFLAFGVGYVFYLIRRYGPGGPGD